MRKKIKGQSLVEYLVLLTVVVLGAVAGMVYFKDTVADSFNTVTNTMVSRAGE